MGIKKWSGATLVGKLLQILTEEPKLVVKGRLYLQHSIHQTVSNQNYSWVVNVENSLKGGDFSQLSYGINQWMHCPLECKTMRIRSKGNLRDDQRVSTWPVSRCRNGYFTAELKSAVHLTMMERSSGQYHFNLWGSCYKTRWWILGPKAQNNVKLCRSVCTGLTIRLIGTQGGVE